MRKIKNLIGMLFALLIVAGIPIGIAWYFTSSPERTKDPETASTLIWILTGLILLTATLIGLLLYNFRSKRQLKKKPEPSAGGKPSGDKPPGDKPSDDKPSGEKPSETKPKKDEKKDGLIVGRLKSFGTFAGWVLFFIFIGLVIGPIEAFMRGKPLLMSPQEAQESRMGKWLFSYRTPPGTIGEAVKKEFSSFVEMKENSQTRMEFTLHYYHQGTLQHANFVWNKRSETRGTWHQDAPAGRGTWWLERVGTTDPPEYLGTINDQTTTDRQGRPVEMTLSLKFVVQ